MHMWLCQVVARLLHRDMEYTNPIPQIQTLVGGLTAAPAQPLLPDTIAPLFDAAIAEGVPVIYVAFGSMPAVAQLLLPQDFLTMARAFARMAPAKVGASTMHSCKEHSCTSELYGCSYHYMC